MKPAPIITEQKALDALCQRLRAAGRFAFDTEFIRDDTYDAALCLIQVADGDEVTLIDPAADVDVAPFWALVTDPALTKVVHAGKEDFDICARRTGQAPRHIFDVQIAAGFVGEGYPLSLSRLMSMVLNKRIAKGQTLTDWLRRPLTEEQLRYAVEDVAFLMRAYEKLSAEIDALGRTAWAREEFARYEELSLYETKASERLVRLKGARTLDPLGLAALEKLVDWRERWAQEKNRPTRAMMRDDVLVEIARRRPKRPTELEVMRGFPQARNPRIIAQILALIEEARNSSPDGWPAASEPRDESPMTRATLDVLSAALRAICVEERLSQDLLGGVARLRELLAHLSGQSAPRPALLTGWREEFIGRRLVSVLQGRSELHLSGWPKDPQITIVTRKP